MWFFMMLFILLAVATAYVTVRDRHHPVHQAPKGDGQGWGNLWPR